MLSALGVLEGGCGASASPEETTVPDSSETPTEETPWPLAIPDGGFILWNAYVLEGSNDYILEPGGSIYIVDAVIDGTMEWNVYTTIDDYYASQYDESIPPLCSFTESVSASADTKIPASTGCVGCGSYYGVEFDLEDPGNCPPDGLAALFDTDGSGDVEEDEEKHGDQWGFSDSGVEGYPDAWVESSTWENKVEYLDYYDCVMIVWSQEWHPPDSSYRPLFALCPLAGDP